jgi:hypothetical protein
VSEDETIPLVVDVVERRPACVLLQAGMGGTSRLISALFDPPTWVLAPNENLFMVRGTMEQWRDFADEVNARFAAKG